MVAEHLTPSGSREPSIFRRDLLKFVNPYIQQNPTMQNQKPNKYFFVVGRFMLVLDGYWEQRGIRGA